MRYAANKGCEVTGITLSPHQAEYVSGHMKMRYFHTATVLCEDFFSYKPLFNQNHTTTTTTTPGHKNGYETPPVPRRLSTSNGSLSSMSSPTKHSSPFRPSRPTSSNRHHHNNSHATPSKMLGNTPSKSLFSGATGSALYDAITMMGVLEELGDDYDRILTKLVKLVKPGGRIYLDFAAECNGKASSDPFVTKHIYPSSTPSTPAAKWINLPRLLQAIDNSALVVDALWDNRNNYQLWAQKCYQKLREREDDFLHQQQATMGSVSDIDSTAPSTTHVSSVVNRNRTNSHATGSAAEASVLSGFVESTANPQNRYLYRLMLTMFAGACTAMNQQNHQCTAYRMVLKLPESSNVR